MRNREPLVSVVIPARNEEKYLPSCLQSLSLQTYKNFELIVVDNNSQDKTAAIARKYGAKVVLEKKQGIIPARNKGFLVSKGEIIARTDADSIVPPDWLEKIVEVFDKNEDIVAVTGSFTTQTWWFPTPLFEIFVFIFTKAGQAITGHTQLHGPNMTIKSSALEKINTHTDDSLVHEDIDLSCHLSEIGKILFVPEIKTLYSLRRVKNKPADVFFEYPFRYIRTIWIHHPWGRRHKRNKSKIKNQKSK